MVRCPRRDQSRVVLAIACCRRLQEVFGFPSNENKDGSLRAAELQSDAEVMRLCLELSARSKQLPSSPIAKIGSLCRRRQRAQCQGLSSQLSANQILKHRLNSCRPFNVDIKVLAYGRFGRVDPFEKGNLKLLFSWEHAIDSDHVLVTTGAIKALSNLFHSNMHGSW